MCKFRCLVCLILLCGLGFGSQPDECLFKKQHLVVSLDWHKEISRPNSIAANRHYFFNRGISNLTLNDTIQMQGLQTDASRVTFGKIALESLGAVAGGYLTVGFLYGLSKCSPDLFNNYLGYSLIVVGIPTGFAGGTTIIGNRLMEPNGVFIKSLIGSSVGIGLGSLIVYAVFYASGPADYPTPIQKWTPFLCSSIIISASLPIAGAVIGYNHNISKKSVIPMMNSPEENEFLDGGSQRNCPSIKLQLITMRF